MLCRRDNFREIQQQKAIEVEAVEVRVWKVLRWRESFRGIQQQEAIKVTLGGYRSRGLERAVMQTELSGDADGCIRES